MPSFSPGLIRFGPFEFDPRSRELRKHGMRVRLTPQERSLLSLLLEFPLRIRTRNEIQRHLWTNNIFVDFEHGMNKVVHSLREALGDSATNPRYIETVNATGYRFMLQLLKCDTVDKRDLFHKTRTIAVLPITTTSPEDLVHRCDRITFHLLAGVSAFRHRVIAQATLKSYKLNGTAPQQAGEILGVDAVISGELTRSEGTLSVTAELIDVSDGSLLSGVYAEVAELPENHCDEQLARDLPGQLRPVLVPLADDAQLTFDGPRRRRTDAPSVVA